MNRLFKTAPTESPRRSGVEYILGLLGDPARLQRLPLIEAQRVLAAVAVLQEQLAALQVVAIGRVVDGSEVHDAYKSGPESLLDVKQAAERLHVSENFLRGEIEKGMLDTIKLGRSLRIEPATLEAYIAERRRGGWRTENP